MPDKARRDLHVIEARVLQLLRECERAHDAVIFLAVESGSRAWGFPSTDSDYDVRFLYLHRPDWYMSIDLVNRRDVIERPITDEIDLSGWDLRKALHLLRKSNPALMEWLQCPLIYQERYRIATRMRELLPRYHSPNAAFFHYLHMAQGNFREYLQGDVVWLKKYLYVLRPLLALRWIERGLGPVPIEFERLVEATADDPGLRAAIALLIEQKRKGAELARGPRVEALSAFVERELPRLEALAGTQSPPDPGPDELDALFRDALAEVWGVPPGDPQKSAGADVDV